MKDVEIRLDDRPGALARMAKSLGEAGISIEGGGAWVVAGRGHAHFLFEDQAPVTRVLKGLDIDVVAERPVIVLKLDQGRPGQLGELTGLVAEAGVNIHAQYSDHDHNLVLVVDEVATARRIAAAWMNDRDARRAR